MNESQETQALGFGRLASKLGLESHLIENGVLPDRQLLERSRIAHGVIEGLLERKEWEKALQLVYEDKTVRVLYEGDRRALHQAVIAAAKQRSTEYPLGDKTTNILCDKWPVEDIRSFIEQVPLRLDDLEELIVRSVASHNAPSTPLYSLLGERALEAKEHQRAVLAFIRSGDMPRFESAYAAMLERMVPGREYETGECVFMGVAEFTKHLAEKVSVASSKMAMLVQYALAPERRGAYVNAHSLLLMSLIDGYHIAVDEESREIVKRSAIQMMPEYELKEHPELELPWALAHVNNQPLEAYSILRRHKHKGPETLAAVRGALFEKDSHGNKTYEKHGSLSSFDKEDLKAVYPDVTLNAKVNIAEHLKDGEKMRLLSRTFFFRARRSKKDKSGWSLEEAYSLWVRGMGDLNGVYITNLRRKIAEQELSSDRPHFSWLCNSDIVGHQQLFPIVLEKVPQEAYGLAKRLGAYAQDQARKRIIERSPEKAFRFFAEEKDRIGLEQANKVLAEKYGVPIESVKPLAEYLLKERSAR